MQRNSKTSIGNGLYIVLPNNDVIMEALLEKQKKAIVELNKFIATKVNTSVPKVYHKNKIKELEKWMNDFTERNTRLAQFEDDDQPYFVENTYAKALQKCSEHMQMLQRMVNQNDESDEEQDLGGPSDPNRNLSEEIQSKITVLTLYKKELLDVCAIVKNMDANASIGEAKAQLEMVRIVFNECRAALIELRPIVKNIDDQINFKTLQQKYMRICGKLNDLMVKPEKERCEVELPKIKLPEFGGKQEEWQPFIELFKKIVHNKNSISDSVKMQYLKSCLKDEAAKVVNHVAPSGENYQACFELLHKRYENKRQILGHLLDSILNLPKQKNENADQLKTLHDTTMECMMAIQNLDIDVSNWDPLLNHILLHKLSSETIKDYECQLADVREPQTLQTFMKFIDSRQMALKSAENKAGAKEIASASAKSNSNSHEKKSKSESKYEVKCLYCEQGHFTSQCPIFLKLNTQERSDWVKKTGLCFNCLYKHKLADCKSRNTCNKCGKKHHTLLHFESNKKPIQSAKNTACAMAQVEEHSNESNNEKLMQEESNLHVAANGPVLLATALVRVENKYGEKILLRALLDQGSQSNFVTENAIQTLGIEKYKSVVRIFGMGGLPSTAKNKANIIIYPKDTDENSFSATAIVVSKITNFQRSEFSDFNQYKHLDNLVLADPVKGCGQKIDLLLGAEEYGNFLKPGLIMGTPNEPFAQNTIFGWIISGKTNSKDNTIHVTTLTSTEEIDEKLSKFFNTEETNDDVQLNDEEQFCENHFEQTHTRNDEGRYVVKMAYKNNETPKLGNSRRIAIAQLQQLEKKFERQPGLKQEYQKFIDEYIKLGHMELATDRPNLVYYLPHHAIFKDSTTTKLRVVFNASQKSDNGRSLNDCLAMGKIEQNDIVCILIQWRQFQFAFSADIEKMYRQIYISEDQHDLQRIVWRNAPNDEILEFKLKTITYGTASAPFLAIRTLQQLAIDVKNEFPIASKLLSKSFYMDDVNGGANNERKVIETYSELSNAMKQAGFNLRKWCSNSKKLLATIPIEQQEQIKKK